MTTWDFSEHPEDLKRCEIGDLAWIGNETTTLTLYTCTGFDGSKARFERCYPIRFKLRPTTANPDSKP
jgi:hypothetical protein